MGTPGRVRLPDFRNLAFCDYRPWPTVDRRLGLVRVGCRRHLYFGIPEFSGFPFYIAVKDEGSFVSDDGTTCLIFALSKVADAILGVGLGLLVVGLDVQECSLPSGPSLLAPTHEMKT